MDIINSREEILEHHKHFLNFVHELSKLDEEVLRQPMQEGKWSIIEVIGHFQPWDQFIIEKRLSYIFSDEALPSSPKDEEVNADAALLARTNPIHITFEKFVATREQFINLVTNLPHDVWGDKAIFSINQKAFNLYDYLKGLMEHDLHHKREVEGFLNSNG